MDVGTSNSPKIPTTHPAQVAVTVSGREHVSTDEEQIAAYVAKNGPVSIGVNAANLQFYMG